MDERPYSARIAKQLLVRRPAESLSTRLPFRSNPGDFK
jgi:hypothetical protein